MSKILILGGGGMIGQKLAAALAGSGDDITLFDVGFPSLSAPGHQVVGNVADPASLTRLVQDRPDVIYHLAAIVSGQAETDFDMGWDINMMAMWHLMTALKAQHDASGGAYVPKVVFTSSIAVFGGPFPAKIGDDFLHIITCLKL